MISEPGTSGWHRVKGTAVWHPVMLAWSRFRGYDPAETQHWGMAIVPTRPPKLIPCVPTPQETTAKEVDGLTMGDCVKAAKALGLHVEIDARFARPHLVIGNTDFGPYILERRASYRLFERIVARARVLQNRENRYRRSVGDRPAEPIERPVGRAG